MSELPELGFEDTDFLGCDALVGVKSRKIWTIREVKPMDNNAVVFTLRRISPRFCEENRTLALLVDLRDVEILQDDGKVIMQMRNLKNNSCIRILVSLDSLNEKTLTE